MSYTMTHIYIAEKVAERLGNITDYPTYLLGSIAPDAVHASDTYVVTDKERSHLFKEGMHWGKISSVGQAGIWEESIRDFYKANKGRYNHDYLLGYIVHLYSDVRSSMHFFYPYICSIGGELTPEHRKHFLKENFGYNYYLFLEYEKNRDLKKELDAGKAETFEGVLAKELVGKRVELLFKQEFTPRDISDIDSYTICSHEAMKKLIDGSAEYVIGEIKKLI
ncbi:MAG: hypothetical protein IKR39_06200 [Lachnospiraceae bacterium]|nr:hypothetical protein [Lachnospiraceae bacterium]